MYSIGDKVVHSPEGVCVIEDITKLEVDKELKEFYMIRSVMDTQKVIYIALDSKMNRIRTLKTKEEIENLLEVEPDGKSFFRQNLQRRANIQKQAILQDDSELLMKLIKLFSRKKEEDYISIGDNIWLKNAEQYLFSEVAEVLGHEYDTLVNKKQCG